MVKKLNKKLISSILVILVMISFTGCQIKSEENLSIESKITEEIDYIENKMFVFLNMYAKNEYGDEDNLNWNLIKENAIELNGILDTIILDMSEVEISNEDIINFKNAINRLSIAVSNEDIETVLEEYRILYSLLPTYAQKSYENKNKLKLLELKTLVVSSYVYANNLDWENAKKTIEDAETKYKTMMDDVDYMKEYSYNLNKVYVLLSELKNAIDIEEVELIKIKYVNFIEKI